jgi:hypothetical protein
MKHKTIGQDTPILTYAIFTRIAAKQAKALRSKLRRQRYKLALKSLIEKVTRKA